MLSNCGAGEDSWESLGQQRDQASQSQRITTNECSSEGRMLKFQYFGHLMRRAESLEKTLMLGKIEGKRRRGWQDERDGWHHQLSGRKFEQTPGDGEGQGSLVCCSPWSHRVGHDWASEQQHRKWTVIKQLTIILWLLPLSITKNRKCLQQESLSCMDISSS